jgi:hypothetical protein
MDPDRVSMPLAELLQLVCLNLTGVRSKIEMIYNPKILQESVAKEPDVSKDELYLRDYLRNCARIKLGPINTYDQVNQLVKTWTDYANLHATRDGAIPAQDWTRKLIALMDYR